VGKNTAIAAPMSEMLWWCQWLYSLPSSNVRFYNQSRPMLKLFFRFLRVKKYFSLFGVKLASFSLDKS